MFFFFSSRRRHTRWPRDWSSDVCSSDLISGVENFGGDYTSIVPLLPSGERTNACHLTWTDEPFKKGPVIIELAGCYERYNSPLARTLVIGEPTKEMEALAFAAVEGINKALEMIKPGVTCAEIDRKSVV